MYYVRLNDQVIVDELSWVGVVSVYTTDLCCGQIDLIETGFGKKASTAA
jgi:hypothetical protein